MKRILLVFLFLFFCSPVLALQNLYFNGFISDNAQVISNDAENIINSYLFDLQKKTGSDIAIVTLDTLNNQSVEQAALEIGRKYKIGAKNLNNGAVILVVVKDRVMRIETGYGLEGIITDAHAGRIRDLMLPYFKNNRYKDGIVKGSYTLASDIAKGYGTELSDNPPKIKPLKSATDDMDYILFLLIWLVILKFTFNFRGGYCGITYLGGGGSSGFGGFRGGGGFAGGGASGRWQWIALKNI